MLQNCMRDFGGPKLYGVTPIVACGRRDSLPTLVYFGSSNENKNKVYKK